MRIKKPIPAWKSLPQLGRIAKGEKGDKHPEDLDYFLVHLNPEYEFLRPTIEEIYGKEPKEFNGVYLVGKTPDEAFSSRKEHWGGNNTCKILCDGETIYKRTDDAGIVNYDNVPCYLKQNGHCATRWNQQKQENEPINCASVGRLSVILRELFLRTGILGAFKIATQSSNDIDMLTATIDGTFERISRMYRISIEDIPFTLGRRPQEIAITDAKGKHINRKFSLLYININLAELLQPQDQQLDRGADTPLIEAETGEAELSLENFKSTVVQLNLTLPAERFSEECKNIGYSSKEEMIETLAKKCKVTIDFKKDPHANVLALGYLCAAKDIPNPYQVALNTVYAEFSEIPW